jgi:hypothetical protein
MTAFRPLMFAALAGLPLTIVPAMAQNETPIRSASGGQSSPAMNQTPPSTTAPATPPAVGSASPGNAGGGPIGGESGGSGSK